MLSEEEKKLLKIFKAQVAKEETEYFTVNAYTQLLYDSHKTALNLINRLQKENEQKDKQIDLMAGYISNLDIDENICKEQSDNNCDDINREADCKDCIKQYFEKISKGEKNKI